MITPVVATLDASRKIEMLKARAEHIEQLDWEKGLKKYLQTAEKVFNARNTACHSVPILENGRWTLKAASAAKLFKNINVKAKTLQTVPVEQLRDAIATGEIALGAGRNLIENFRHLNAEMARHIGSKS